MKYTIFIAHLLQLTLAHVSNDYDVSRQLTTRSDNLSTNITQRDVAQCGPAYSNAVCDSSQCCSPDGSCGTGGSYCFAPACLFQYGPACDANAVPSGSNTSPIPRPKFGNIPYGVNIFHCNRPDKVALTFDDGPWIYTSDLLNTLKSNNVKATFFMVANNNGKGQIELESTPWPEIMQRVVNEGHQLGSHTWSHQDLSTLTAQQITDQIIKNEIAFADVLAFFPTYLRPPYESCNALCQSILGSLGYHILNYDVDTLDWQENYDNSRNIFTSALKAGNSAASSFIPLTHDIHQGTVYGFVQYMIDTLRSQGYTTALVGECLNDPPANWYRDAKTGQQWSGVLPSSLSAQSNAPSSPSSSGIDSGSLTLSGQSSSSTHASILSTPISSAAVVPSTTVHITAFANVISSHSTTNSQSKVSSSPATSIFQSVHPDSTTNVQSSTSSPSRVPSSDSTRLSQASLASYMLVIVLALAF